MKPDEPAPEELRRTLQDRFLVFPDRRGDVSMVVGSRDLMDPDTLRSFLRNYAETVGANRLHTAASRFVYHMMRPFLKSNLYLLGRYSRTLTVDFQAVAFECHEEAETGHEWGMNLGREITVGGSQQDRSRVREYVFRRVFGYYDAVFEIMRETTRIPPRTLWDNLSHVTVLYYQNWCEEADSEAIRDQFRSDLESLKDPVEGLDTGTLSSFVTEYSRRQTRDGQFVRSTCCLNFRLEDYCRECPLPEK